MNVDWDIKIDNVQQYWKVFESLLIKIVDEIVPLTEFSGNIINMIKLKLKLKLKLNLMNM